MATHLDAKTENLAIGLRRPAGNWRLIAVRSPAAAARLMSKIESRMLQLLDHPELGPRRGNVRANTRTLVVKPHLLLYEMSGDEIIVLRCVDGRRHQEEWL